MKHLSKFDDINKSIDQLTFPRGKVRLSVAHLVPLIGTAGGEEEDALIVRLSNGAHRRKLVRYDAIGGVIALTEAGVGYLTGLGASNFELDDKGRVEARFIAPDQWTATEILKWFANLGNASAAGLPIFESSPAREVLEELGDKELEGIAPAVPRQDPRWTTVSYKYLGVAVQTAPRGTSFKESGAIQTRRIFHCWKMVVPYDNGLYDDIVLAKPLVLRLDRFSVAFGDGSHLLDGTPLADNVGLSIIPV